MKIIFLCLTFYFIAQAQGKFNFFFDEQEEFPLVYDKTNLIAVYDGDKELTTSTWGDQSANNYDLTLLDTPTIVPNAINGHQAIQFNGTSEYGESGALTLNQPLTFYIVFKQITFTVNDRIFGAKTDNVLLLFQNGTSPNLTMYAGGLAPNTTPDLTLDTYGIITAVFNGASSKIRTNDNAAVTGNTGTGNSSIIRLALGNAINQYGHIEVAYFIIRSGADNTAAQNRFITYLKNRFNL